MNNSNKRSNANRSGHLSALHLNIIDVKQSNGMTRIYGATEFFRQRMQSSQKTMAAKLKESFTKPDETTYFLNSKKNNNEK